MSNTRASWMIVALALMGCGGTSGSTLHSPDGGEGGAGGELADGPVASDTGVPLSPDAEHPGDGPVDLPRPVDLAAVDAPSDHPATSEDTAACGAVGQRCCADNKCTSGADCEVVLDVGSICNPCGVDGQHCCKDGNPCRDAGDRCSGGICSHDSSGCGLVGGPCCVGFRCNDTDAVCVGANQESATCKRCGHTTGDALQPCCAGNTCLDGGCCVHLQSGNIGPSCVKPGQICWELNSSCGTGGSCGPSCGGANQACCQGLGVDYCSASGTACMRTTAGGALSCIPCGQKGQPCCQQVASQFSIPACGAGLQCTAGSDPRCMPL